MNIASGCNRHFTLFFVLCAAQVASAQVKPGILATAVERAANTDFEQTVQILKLDPMIRELRVLQAQRPCGSAATLEELTLRLDLMESI